MLNCVFAEVGSADSGRERGANALRHDQPPNARVHLV